MKTDDFIKRYCIGTTCPDFDDRYGCRAYDGEECDEAFSQPICHGLKMADRVIKLCERRHSGCTKLEDVETKKGSKKKKVQNTTADECIDRIAEVLSRDMTISDGPHFHMDGRSTNIIYPSGKDTLERLFEISSIIKDYKKENLKRS